MADTLRATGMLNNPKALDMVARVCRWVYRRMDHIVVLSPGFKRLLQQRGVPDSKLSVIYNWADGLRWARPWVRCLPPSQVPASSAFCCRQHGQGPGLGYGAGCRQLAANPRQPRVLGDVGRRRGGGAAEGRSCKAATGQYGVFARRAHGWWVPTCDAADALLVHLRKDPLFEITIPSKTQAYMTVGKPLLMVDGDAADLVRQSGGVAESENPEALACAAEQLAAMPVDALAAMGDKAQHLPREHLAWPRACASSVKF